MQVRFNCQRPDCVALIELEPFEQCGGTIRCPRCQYDHPIRITESMRKQRMMDRCAVCGETKMFIRKDFPQRIGLIVVIVAGLASIALFKISLLMAYGVLAAAVVIDLVLYMLTGRVTCCYACRAEYRNVVPNPAHEGFDLETQEHLRFAAAKREPAAEGSNSSA